MPLDLQTMIRALGGNPTGIYDQDLILLKQLREAEARALPDASPGMAGTIPYMEQMPSLMSMPADLISLGGLPSSIASMTGIPSISEPDMSMRPAFQGQAAVPVAAPPNKYPDQRPGVAPTVPMTVNQPINVPMPGMRTMYEVSEGSPISAPTGAGQILGGTPNYIPTAQAPGRVDMTNVPTPTQGPTAVAAKPAGEKVSTVEGETAPAAPLEQGLMNILGRIMQGGGLLKGQPPLGGAPTIGTTPPELLSAKPMQWAALLGSIGAALGGPGFKEAGALGAQTAQAEIMNIERENKRRMGLSPR